MTYLIIGGVLAFALFLAFVPKMVEARRIMAKANADYARCRGTYHARQLRENWGLIFTFGVSAFPYYGSARGPKDPLRTKAVTIECWGFVIQHHEVFCE